MPIFLTLRQAVIGKPWVLRSRVATRANDYMRGTTPTLRRLKILKDEL